MRTLVRINEEIERLYNETIRTYNKYLSGEYKGIVTLTPSNLLNTNTTNKYFYKNIKLNIHETDY